MAALTSRDAIRKVGITPEQRAQTLAGEWIGHIVIPEVRRDDQLSPLAAGLVLGAIGTFEAASSQQEGVIVPYSEVGSQLALLARQTGSGEMAFTAAAIGAYPNGVLHIPTSRISQVYPADNQSIPLAG